MDVGVGVVVGVGVRVELAPLQKDHVTTRHEVPFVKNTTAMYLCVRVTVGEVDADRDVDTDTDTDRDVDTDTDDV